MLVFTTFLAAGLGSLLLCSLQDTKLLTLVDLLCQFPTRNVLEGCPQGTVVVGKNATYGHFSTTQSAIRSLPNDTTTSNILILPGSYTEQLNITRRALVRLIGQTSNPQEQSKNLVTVSWASANGAGSGFDDNAYTSVLTVALNLNASLTGSGPTGFNVPPDTPFGCPDFRAYNLDFRNVHAEHSAGASLAVSISRANAGFYQCGIYSYQDIVYVGHQGNLYFYGGEIAGQTDFLSGFGTTWIEKSKLVLRGCSGGIIAWKGSNTTFPNKYGCYVAYLSLEAANSTVAAKNLGRCLLGRPWNALHRSVYMESSMDATILPQGYTKWSSDPAKANYNDLTVMAEYSNHGPGWNVTARNAGNITLVLNKAGLLPYYSPAHVFMTTKGKQPHVAWIDGRFYPY